MKYVLAFAALFALIGFVGVSRAADPKPKLGHFLKVEDKVVTYKGGAKGTGKEHTVKIDDSTKITLDGKDAKIEDIKADTYIEITAKGRRCDRDRRQHHASRPQETGVRIFLVPWKTGLIPLPIGSGMRPFAFQSGQPANLPCGSSHARIESGPSSS